MKTEQIVSDYIPKIILFFYDGGNGKYIDHRRERDNKKGSKISDTIKKVNYPSFLFSAAEATMKQQNSKNKYSRRQNLNQKHIVPLVNELEKLINLNQKHIRPLVNEIEKLINLASPKFLKYSCKPTTLLADFMPIIRQASLKNMSRVIATFDLSWKAINNGCGHDTLSIFDYYI